MNLRYKHNLVVGIVIGLLSVVPLHMQAAQNAPAAPTTSATPTYTSKNPPFDPFGGDSSMSSSSILSLESGDPVTVTYWVINILLSFLGLAFVVLLVYGGTVWIVARGNSEEIEKAKKFIRNGLIGLIIVLASYSTSAVIFDIIGTSYVGPEETAP